MKRKVFWIILFLIGFVVSGFIGTLKGSTALTKLILEKDLGTNITELNCDLKVLDLLKRNEKGKAEELLENIIDHHISNLGEQAKDEFYSKSRADIMDAIQRAKSYRSK